MKKIKQYILTDKDLELKVNLLISDFKKRLNKEFQNFGRVNTPLPSPLDACNPFFY